MLRLLTERRNGPSHFLVLAIAFTLSCKTPSTPERSDVAESRPRNATPIAHSAAAPAPPELSSEVQDGDLVFQESTSSQSELVQLVTRSRWTHMGVVFNEPDGPIVLEAVSPVRKTALETWIARGRDRIYVIKRLRTRESQLSSDALKKMRDLGATWIGRPYDLQFRWDDESLYCSELAYKLFDSTAGVRLGKLEKAGDMALDDPRVHRELQKRFAGIKLDPSETVVTPDSIFNDEQLVHVGP